MKAKPQRVDSEFLKEMKQLAKMRYMNNLAKREPSFAEMTRLLRRTSGYNQSINDLRTKPRKEDL